MQRALDLADLALGRTSPNPAVGAVLERDGRVVGEGFTQPPGQAHAEVVAIEAANALARGAELYVTLEPCCHYGRTPPCTLAVVKSGIRAVHVATLDPNPRVNGKGLAALREAGLAVDVGAHAGEAQRLNAAFFHFIRTGRPFVTAKWAMTLDGKIATRTGDSRWVTGPEARHAVHVERDASDAIVVGIGTALADDPALTVRLDPADARRPPRKSPPWRVVLDSQARLPLSAQLVRENSDRRTLVIAGELADPGRVAALSGAGVEVIRVATDSSGRVEIDAALAVLAKRGAIRVLVEGGGELVGGLLESRRVDRVMAFVAPKIVGGAGAKSPVGATGFERMTDALNVLDVEVRTLGYDVLIEGQLHWSE
jgi:diaminohydroxyphosphoribosylaminopyrimidine deaminase/5-amino-6-(5-phosphoribosylamino)uracil reductase